MQDNHPGVLQGVEYGRLAIDDAIDADVRWTTTANHQDRVTLLRMINRYTEALDGIGHLCDTTKTRCGAFHFGVIRDRELEHFTTHLADKAGAIRFTKHERLANVGFAPMRHQKIPGAVNGSKRIEMAGRVKMFV